MGALASSSMMYVLSALASTREKAHALAIMPQMAQFMFSGILLPTNLIPMSLQWVKYVCPLYYGLGLVAATEFHYLYAEEDACIAQYGLEEWKKSCPSIALRQKSLEAHDV